MTRSRNAPDEGCGRAGLIRARTAGPWAGYGLIAWSVLHVLSFSPWVEVVGATAQALGLAAAATALLREGLV